MTVLLDDAARLMIGRDIGVAEHDGISDEWCISSYRWRGVILVGAYTHWCPDWDFLPIDETCPEWPCPCSVSRGVDEDGIAKRVREYADARYLRKE